MISNSDVVYDQSTYTTTFPTEVMNWYYNNDKDSIIVIWNNENEVVYVSQLFEELFEKNVETILGKDWTTLLPKEQVKQINNHFKSDNTKLKIPNITLSFKKGKDYSFNAIVDRISIDGEKFSVCQLRNTTYLNKLKQVLLDSEKLILAGQLSAGLVHEIRNPLTSLKGFLQLVQAGVQQKEEYYKVMIGEIEKLEKITSELLHMARPFKSQKRIEYVHQMVDDVLFLMNNQTDMKNVEFNIDIDDRLMTHCNASQIKQVLINLIKNGAEAMQKSGTIYIKSRLIDEYIEIAIQDEGQGVPDELLQQLHDPFFTTKEEGTGLGLVITEHILDIHQGRLKVSSEKEKGTTFTVLLPAYNEQ